MPIAGITKVTGFLGARHQDATLLAGRPTLLGIAVGQRQGGSSGADLIACLQLASGMRARGETGSIVSLPCGRGERYRETLLDTDWLASRGANQVKL